MFRITTYPIDDKFYGVGFQTLVYALPDFGLEPTGSSYAFGSYELLDAETGSSALPSGITFIHDTIANTQTLMIDTEEKEDAGLFTISYKGILNDVNFSWAAVEFSIIIYTFDPVPLENLVYVLGYSNLTYTFPQFE